MRTLGTLLPRVLCLAAAGLSAAGLAWPLLRRRLVLFLLTLAAGYALGRRKSWRMFSKSGQRQKE